MGLLKNLVIFIVTCSLCVHRAASWGVVDWVVNTWNENKETVTETWDTVTTYVSDGAADVYEFFTNGLGSEIVASVLESISKAFTVATDQLEEAVGGFNVTTWKKMAKGAKMVMVGLPDEVRTRLSTGVNYLVDKIDFDVVPFPLNVVKDDDMIELSKCLGPSVYNLATNWTKDVATTFTSIVGDHGDYDFTPLLNTEQIEDQLNDTYTCLYQIGNELRARAKEEVKKQKTELLERMDEYFEFQNLTVTIEVTFTACTLTCGTASLGFAVNTENIMEHSPFYTVSMGVDSGSVVGAAIGARVGFRPHFNITGLYHGVGFGIKLKLPLLPSLPDVTVAMSGDEGTRGDFEGFLLKSELLDLSLGITGVFGVGYQYTKTKFVYTTDDLREAWGAVDKIVNDRLDTIDAVSNAWTKLTNGELDVGGYILKASQNSVGKLLCPSGLEESHSENMNIGNLSVLQLGMLEIYEVIYGNIKGQHSCNSTAGYEAVTSKCQYGSNCDVNVNAASLGDVECDSSDLDLTVIYGCPNQVDVYNLGCWEVMFRDVMDRDWIQDQTVDLLSDGWLERRNGIAKCSKLARERGYPGFAMYNGGMCLMADNLFEDGVYNEYGNETDECPMSGLGNDELMNLYAFVHDSLAYDDLGCINDTEIEMYNEAYKQDLEGSFETLEGEHFMFADDYSKRHNAVSKCGQIAKEKGYKGFVLSDGGKCLFSNKLDRSVVNNIRTLANTSNDTSVGCGLGDADTYMAFAIPGNYASSNKSEDGLSAMMIGLLIGGPIALICICLAVFFMVRYCKRYGKDDQTTDDGSEYVSMYHRITGK